MSNFKKLMMTAAGGDVLNVEDVFSTYVYDGNSSNRSITNNIDLSTEGGLVWIKGRTSTTYDFNHTLFDTERGAGYRVSTDMSDQERYNNNTLTSFNTDGFSLGTDGALLVNWSSNDYVSWTFRKAPKFFDVVTWTGDGTAGRSISHDLGSTPGFITIKRLDSTGSWYSWHRSLNTSYGLLNQTSAFQTGGAQYVFGNNTSVVQPTSSAFTVGTSANGSGATYVAYLFAHNDGDGDFGPTGDQDIIKCGSYTGTGASGNSIDLGFEPQWLFTRRTNATSNNGHLWDVTRGMSDNGSVGICQRLEVNTSNIERDNREGPTITSNGFVLDSTSSDTNGTNDEYIYIAIRRGPMAVPTDATDVFDVSDGSAGASGNAGRYRSGFPVDMALEREPSSTDNWEAVTRLLQGTSLRPNGTNAEDTGIGNAQFDYMDGWNSGSAFADSYSWMWKRAPNYFDVVAYTGNSTAGRTVKHNLGVAPEMIWVKKRNSSSNSNWFVFHSGIGNGKFLLLNTTSDATTSTIAWNDTDPTETTFTLGVQQNVNYSNDKYIAYLFATLAGISKVGGYTGNGSSQTIDCGFTSGARFILIKRTDAGSTGDWHFWDTERGIVAGNDPFLELNTTSTQNSSYDSIDPDSSGFIVNQDAGTNINVSSATYIFYAIA